MALKVVVLAAGQGTRMRSNWPKVLHPLGGKPILHRLLDSVNQIEPEQICVVYGHQGELLRDETNQYDIEWVYQADQLGTAHAVQQSLEHIQAEDTVLVLTADVPLISSGTLSSLMALVDQAMALVTVSLPDASGYGRIVRDANGNVQRIVEHKDASPEERMISEINTGIMGFKGAFLLENLPNIQNQNAQKEFYLTDILALAVDQGHKVQTLEVQNPVEVEGVNTKSQLAALERRFQLQNAEQLMEAGLTLLDPARFDLRGSLNHGKDSVVDVNVVFEGNNTIGSKCLIGANCVLKNVTLGDGVEIKPMSILEDVQIGHNAAIGPFARLRPGTEVSDDAKIGNFVEIKKAKLGKGSKVSHLSYIGDAKIGEEVNIGAGTITCNYDGVNKHLTEIEDGAFIGSNSSLVAPVKIGKESNVGAGSVISKDTPAGKLSLARAKQITLDKWLRPTKK